jgi:uncharacterized protein YneF (UPF0154 family)
VSLILLIIGCVIGMFGSYRAVRKYLKIWKKILEKYLVWLCYY